MSLNKCAVCGGARASTAKACPHCGDTKPLGSANPVVIIPALIIFAVVLLVYYWGPSLNNYRLKAGHAACTTEDAVVEYRGASLLGITARARVLSGRDCILGPIDNVTVTRKARGGQLIHKVKIDGRALYADKGAIEK